MRQMRFHMLFLIFVTCTCFIDTGQSVDIHKCFFRNDTKNNENEKLMNVLSPIAERVFQTEKDGYSYMMLICNDMREEDADWFTTVTRRKNNENAVVLGRRNDTQLIQGDNWAVVVFGSGDYITGNKNLSQRRAASIYLFCNPHSHDDKSSLQLVQEDGRNYIFILPTEIVCPANNRMSGMKIFLLILSITFSAYCLVGIIYRRLVHNAQRCQQIPNFTFWSRIGNKLADGCCYVCRCDAEPEDSWNNITSNFESGDRDDALLRP